MKKKALALCLALCMALSLLPTASLAATPDVPTAVDKANTVDMEFTTLDGETVSTKTHPGKPQLWVFFSGGGFCGKSTAAIQGLVEGGWDKRDDVQVIAVNIPDEVTEESYRAFISKYAGEDSGIKFCMTSSFPRTIHEFLASAGLHENGVIQFAANVLLDADNVIRYSWEGSWDPHQYDEVLAELTEGSGGNEPEPTAEPTPDPTAEPLDFKDSGGLSKLSRTEIVSLLEESIPDIPDTVFDEEPSTTAPYTLGKVNEDVIQMVVDRLNMMRRLAGLPSVTMDAALNESAQYGSVLLAAHGKLDHHPGYLEDMDNDFFAKGSSATASSNIYMGRNLIYSVDSYMSDSDSSNISRIGHRRWQLNPKLGKVGFGDAASGSYHFSAEKVFDQSGPGVDYDFISWPASGDFPNELFGTSHAWSVTLDPRQYSTPSLSSVSVELIREEDGKSWSFFGDTYSPSSKKFFNVDNGGYGVSNCIIFRPDGIEQYDGTYTVIIKGLETKAGKDTTLAYQVNFFRAGTGSLPYASTKPLPTPTPTPKPTHTVTFDPDGGITDITSITVKDGESMGDRAPRPTRLGYDFMTWRTEPNGGGTNIHANFPIHNDYHLYAHWQKAFYLTIAFDPNGGTVEPKSNYAESVPGFGYKLTKFPTPTRSGYTFDGWYTQKSGGEKVDASFPFSADTMTIYAHWTKGAAPTPTPTATPSATPKPTPSAVPTASPSPAPAASIPPTGTAYPSTQSVEVDGRSVEFQMYALKDANGYFTNYVKARDLALALNGTTAQFSVGWNGVVDLTAKTAYTANGSENSTPFSGERRYTLPANPTNVNGTPSDLIAILLNDDAGGGYTYYQLRDLGRKLGFQVGWSAQRGVFVETDKPYQEES